MTLSYLVFQYVDDLIPASELADGSTRSTGLARTDANMYTENGGIATRTRSEDLLVNTTPFGRQTYETWGYDLPPVE